MMPLVFTQLITSYIWVSLACLEGGYFKEIDSNQLQVQGSVFWNYFSRRMLLASIQLDPISVYLYTWQMIPILETEEKSVKFKKFYKFYKKFSIWIVPITLSSLYITTSVLDGEYWVF